MLRRLAFALPLLFASALVAGCDSGTDERTDAERIVGTWDATGASVLVNAPVVGETSINVVDATSEGGITLVFTSSSAYTMTVEGPIEVSVLGQSYPVLGETDTQTLTGTYAVRESDGEIDFTGSQTGAVSTEVPYRFPGDDQLRFTLRNGQLIADLIVLANPDVDPALASLITGGEMTLARR